jgi:hypothetical protein
MKTKEVINKSIHISSSKDREIIQELNVHAMVFFRYHRNWYENLLSKSTECISHT